MFDKYLFRPHMLGSIMGGVKSGLTDNQKLEYEKLISKHKNSGKSLTLTQALEYGKLRNKLKNPSKSLTEKQKNKMFELMLKHESKTNSLTINEILSISKLIDKKNSSNVLDQTAKTTLNNLAKSYITNRKSVFTSERTEKGLICENKALDLVAKIKGIRIKKNKLRIQNSFLSGEIDSMFDESIIDVKVSYSIDTFPMFDKTNKTLNYDWQGDGYMDLWGKLNHEIHYCLVDTPSFLLNRELSKYCSNKNIDTNQLNEENIEDIKTIVSKHIFTNKGLEYFCSDSIVNIEWFSDFYEIPIENRVKIFINPYCEDRNKNFKDMIILAREYMNNLVS